MTKERLDGFLIRSFESVAEGLEKGGSAASAARELRRLLSCVEDRSDEPPARRPCHFAAFGTIPCELEEGHAGDHHCGGLSEHRTAE